ncbi:MAG TPA: EthD family reductase [Anaerolineales bacterium]
MKLIALYKQPADPAAFDQAYFNTHLPLMNRVPGLRRTVITRFSRTLMGEGFYLMAEMYFTDLKAAMKSPEMAAAGDNLNTFAKDLAILMFGDEQEQPVSAA